MTPSPNKYKIPSDNPNFKKTVIAEIKEEKFFEFQNMKKIKAKVPI